MQIFLLEDDAAQADMQLSWLDELGHKTHHVTTLKAFKASFKSEAPDLFILDWELPDGTGLDALDNIRHSQNAQAPVLFTTHRDSEEDIVIALTAGADDYLCKPLRHQEYCARINALFRRAGIDQNLDTIEEGPFFIDTQSKAVSNQGVEVKLTQKDYALSLELFTNIGKALSREYLLQSVWGVNSGLDTRTVDMHVSRVRRALTLGPETGYIIKTIYQFGYRLEPISQAGTGPKNE